MAEGAEREFVPRVPEERAYHGLLLAVLLPIVSLPLTWGAALWARRRARGRPREARRWSRLLLILALVDTLFGAAVLVALYAPPPVAEATRESRPRVDEDARPGRHGLFVPAHPREAAQCALDAAPELGWRDLAFPGAALLLVVAFGVRARQRGDSQRTLALGVAALLASFAIAAATRAVGCVAIGGHSVGTLVLAQLAQALALASLGGWLARRWRRPRRMPLPVLTARTFYYAACWAPRALAIALVVARVEASLGLQIAGPLAHLVDAELGMAGVLMVLLASAVLGPLGEELLFRGALQPWLRERHGPAVAITGAAAIFALMHVQHGAAMVVPFVLGAVFGWSRERGGTVAAAVIVHGLFNAASVGLALLH